MATLAVALLEVGTIECPGGGSPEQTARHRSLDQLQVAIAVEVRDGGGGVPRGAPAVLPLQLGRAHWAATEKAMVKSFALTLPAASRHRTETP
jgi:hypothetical protein